jgi:hypothetical protein
LLALRRILPETNICNACWASMDGKARVRWAREESASWGFPPSLTSDQITKILIVLTGKRRESAEDWPGKAGAAAGPAAYRWRVAADRVWGSAPLRRRARAVLRKSDTRPCRPFSSHPPHQGRERAAETQKWLANSPASTRDPRFSRSSARSLPTIRPASGRKRWRPVSLGAQPSSGDLIVADSEGGEVTLPSFRKIIRNARPVFNEDNDNV